MERLRVIGEYLTVCHHIFKNFENRIPLEAQEVYRSALCDLEEACRFLLQQEKDKHDSVFPPTMKGFKWRMLYITLRENDWNRTKAARALGVSVRGVGAMIQEMRRNGIIIPPRIRVR